MIEVAKKAVQEAGEIALVERKKGLRASSKSSETDISTKGDKLAEEKIFEVIGKNYPNHKIISEEFGSKDGDSEYTWVIDPIDGTLAYYSGLDTFGVSVGILKDDQPYIGVINFPAIGKLFWAQKNKGAFLNGDQISVSKEGSLEKAIVGFDFGYSGREEEANSLLIPLVDKVRYTPIFACTVFGLCSVSNGVYDAYIHEALIWDFAAGAVIVEEAGGRTTDYKGNKPDWTKKWINIVASNGVLHDKVLSEIKV